MTFYLAGLSSLYLFGIFFIPITIFSVGGLYITHKYIFPNLHLKDNRFLVPFFTINGAILGFILAMVLVESWKNFQEEKENNTIEVANYIHIYRNTHGFSPKDSVLIKGYVKKIVKTIIDKAWLELENGGNGKDVTAELNELQYHILLLNTKNSEQRDLRKMILKNINKASELRRHRILKATEDVVPERMWIVVICCVFISIFTGFFFIIKPFSIHVVLTVLQCTMLSFVLFLMISFLYPYRGPMKIEPNSFQKLLIKTFPRIDKESV